MTVPRTGSSRSPCAWCFFACLFVICFDFCKEIFVFCITNMIFWSLMFVNPGLQGKVMESWSWAPKSLSWSLEYIMPWHDNSGHECYVLVPLPKNNNQLQPIVTNAVRIGKRQPANFAFPPKTTDSSCHWQWKKFWSWHHFSFFSSSKFFCYCIYFL